MENVWHTPVPRNGFPKQNHHHRHCWPFSWKNLPSSTVITQNVFSTYNSDFTKSSCTAQYILFEVRFQSWLRSCTASWINSQRQLVQRWTTITEVIVWQEFNTRQLQSHWHKQHYLYICHMQLFSAVINSIYRQHMLAYLAVTLCWSP